jgi:hypothetical protein
MKYFAISILSAALVCSPAFLRADDDTKDKASDKVAETNKKTHEKICEGHHGTVTAKTDNTVTIDGQQYAMKVGTPVNKQEDSTLLKGVKVGDTVCYTTQKAADGSQQISQIIGIAKDEKVRVREKESDSPSKVEVETPNKKIEVK